jgi:hypothetical protein
MQFVSWGGYGVKTKYTMTYQIRPKYRLLVVVAIFGLLFCSQALFAQGRSEEALEHVKEVQERNTERLMAIDGVEGTAVGINENNQLAVKVFTAGPGVRGIPNELEDVPVQVVVTGKFYALPKPPSPPGQDKKNPPPKAPTGLTATAVSNTAIELDWNDNSELDLAGYNVYCSMNSGGPYGYVDSVDISNYSHTGLAAGTTYYYVVTAVDTAFKESDNSNEASATTEGGPVEPPAAPTNLTAIAVSSSQIDLNWTDNANNETGFKIERNSVPIDTVGANETSYSDTGLDPSTTYTYRVCAYNDVGNSDYSNSDSATTDPLPDKPPHWCERPVPIGVSTGHPDITAGTIGCRVTDGSNVFALSNNHVYANENLASIGDNVLQPGTYDGGVDPDDMIGTLADFEPINFHPRARNKIDAAIALTSTDMVGNATPSGDPDYPDGYGTPSSTTATAYVGMEVQKYGRTTGHTYGDVTGINATVRVGYSTRSAIFVEQILIEPGGFSAGGDSGSLVVTKIGKNPVGLLFAGSSTMTVANPIDLVLERFGVTVDGQ